MKYVGIVHLLRCNFKVATLLFPCSRLTLTIRAMAK